MSVPTDRLRDKRPHYLRIFETEYRQLGTITKSVRPYAIAVYACIAHHANSKTDSAFPSYATICEETGMSRPTATKAVDALVAAGLLSVQAQWHKGERTSNLYTLLSVVVNEADNHDVVVSETANLVSHAADVAKDANKVVNQTGSNQIHESDELNQMNESEDTAASGGARRARHSPLPPAVYDFPQMKRDPAEISAELRAEWAKHKKVTRR